MISGSSPPSFTSTTFAAAGVKSERRRELPRDQEMERREIGGARPWWRGYTAGESPEKGTRVPLPTVSEGIIERVRCLGFGRV